MYPAEIIVRKMQSTSGFVIVQLFAKSVRQSRKPANLHPNREVLALDKAGAYVAQIGASVAYLDYGFYHPRRRVASSSAVRLLLGQQRRFRTLPSAGDYRMFGRPLLRSRSSLRSCQSRRGRQ